MEVSTVVRRAEYRIDLYRNVRSMNSRLCVWEPDQSIPGGRSTIEVDVYAPEKMYGEPAGSRVSWPSTGDKRPLVARALAEALTLAAAEADRLNDLAYVMDGDYDGIKPGTLVFLVDDQVDIGEGVPATWKVVDPVLHDEAFVPSGSLAKAVS